MARRVPRGRRAAVPPPWRGSSRGSRSGDLPGDLADLARGMARCSTAGWRRWRFPRYPLHLLRPEPAASGPGRERCSMPAPDPFNGALVRFTVGQETGKYCLNEAWDTMAMPTGNPYPLDSHCSKDCTSERLPAHCAPARLPLSAGCIE